MRGLADVRFSEEDFVFCTYTGLDRKFGFVMCCLLISSRCVASLELSFFICEVGIIIVPTLQGCSYRAQCVQST